MYALANLGKGSGFFVCLSYPQVYMEHPFVILSPIFPANEISRWADEKASSWFTPAPLYIIKGREEPNICFMDSYSKLSQLFLIKILRVVILLNSLYSRRRWGFKEIKSLIHPFP